MADEKKHFDIAPGYHMIPKYVKVCLASSILSQQRVLALGYQILYFTWHEKSCVLL